MKAYIGVVIATFLVSVGLHAQIESGSNGSDGPLNPTEAIVIDMADHPSGIYHYTEVNIPVNVGVTFIPNANNTPVVWLVQGDCVINGSVDLSGRHAETVVGGLGGPGGFRGGNGGTSGNLGHGPGTGLPAAYGALPTVWNGSNYETYTEGGSSTYGNKFILPLLGGSGATGFRMDLVGGGSYTAGGGGGGGAILIVAPQSIELNGSISSNGGSGGTYWCGWGCAGSGGGGSGGAIRMVTQKLVGAGYIGVGGGGSGQQGGRGRVRFDTLENAFGGTIDGVFTQGFQPIIIPTPGQGAQLIITSIGGVPVSVSPTGQLTTPDAVLSAQQNNPVPITVQCSNIPLNTLITVSVRPSTAPAVSATGYNNIGTPSSSTATISINMPRGGGIIYATATN